MQDTQLPQPDSVALEHSERLCAVLKQRISDAGGIVSFSQYMQSALYEPGLGYYMAGAAKFGAEGDFVTAPEVSPLFGGAIASQVTEVLDELNGGSVLELGAGSGRLALELVRELAGRPDFRYCILEPSAELAQRQRLFLLTHLSPEAMACVSWLNELPDQFSGVIVANEVMDALPVERFVVHADALMQHCVTSELSRDTRMAGDALNRAIVAIEKDLGYAFATGYESEVNLLLTPWIDSLAESLTQGVLLLIDYGYPRQEFYSEERHRGTLACYYRHRMHDDPLHLPGLQDITAHVDFTAAAEAGVEAGLELLGYASQSAFLLDNGLLDLAASAQATMTTEMQRMTLARQIKTLTLPGEMGERFQVLALGKLYDRPLQGFRTQDLTYRL